jgi:hypothetical protein
MVDVASKFFVIHFAVKAERRRECGNNTVEVE